VYGFASLARADAIVKTRTMASPTVALKVNYHGIVPSLALKSQVAAQVEKLVPFSSALDVCTLGVGCWWLHRGEGHMYRVTLDIALEKPKDNLTTKFESSLGADAAVMTTLLSDAFDAAVRQVRARVNIGA
jgi:hypothetical protein